jgi:hypothetical protein
MDLDPSRIYYFGNSFGGEYDTQFLAVEPNVRAGDLTVAGGSEIAEDRFAHRTGLGTLLAARVPSLLNAPGVTTIDGVSMASPFFNENLPLRDGVPLHVRLINGTSYDIQSPVSNTVAGAMAIQEVIENAEWAIQSGDALGYVSHLRKDPLAGVPPKSVLFQFPKGDQGSTNPAETELVRAGDLADRATFYRHDLAFAENPALPKNPHTFMTSGIANLDWRAIALGAQEQIASFFASDGQQIMHPEPNRFLEVPIQGPLPESLNYIP